MRFSVRFMSRTISRTSQSSGARPARDRPRARASRSPLGPDDDRADLGLVQPEPQQHVVELAEGAQRPVVVARRVESRRAWTAAPVRRAHGEVGDATVALEADGDVPIGDRRVGDLRRQRAERDARARRRAIRCGRQLRRTLRHRLLEAAGRVHRVDQPPLDRAASLHAFDERAEDVGAGRAAPCACPRRASGRRCRAARRAAAPRAGSPPSSRRRPAGSRRTRAPARSRRRRRCRSRRTGT